ncbi:hypothetical protein CH063_12112 [Colletotrichum higginsianum]|nr:hypothetical protein CH063_12112 [Colletotrichum higginsianum]
MQGEKVAHGKKGALAVEDFYMEKPMGYHVRDGGQSLSDKVWKDPKQRKKIFDYCPEISMIMDMKLERERCDGDNKEGGIGPTDAEKEKAAEEAKKAAEEAAKAKAEEEERRKKEGEEEKKKQEEENKKKQEQAGDNDEDDPLANDADAKAKAMAAEAQAKAASANRI